MPRSTTTTTTNTTTTNTNTITTTASEPITLRLEPVDDTQNSNLLNDGSKSPHSGDKKCVSWTEDVIDNENLGRKKTKICCIFHPQNEDEFELDENKSDNNNSSSSSSSSSSDESDAEPNAYERQPKYRRKKNSSHNNCNHSTLK